MKRTLGFAAIIMLALLAVPLVAAEQLTTVAVFNLQNVMIDYYQDSGAVREFRAAEQQYRDQIARFDDTLQDYQARRADALDRNDSRTAQRLREDIAALEDDIRALQERWLQQQEQLQSELAGDAFYVTLYETVGFVAEDNGFTLVLEETQLGGALFWFSPDVVDITDEIVTELQRRAR
jgi:Skp family chaperone for outer membrane proteins